MSTATNLPFTPQEVALSTFREVFETDKAHLKGAINWLSQVLAVDVYPDENLRDVFNEFTDEQCSLIVSAVQKSFY